MPEHYAEYLYQAGFDILSLANNHSNDKGEEGRISTKEILDKYSIKYAGYLDFPATVLRKTVSNTDSLHSLRILKL